MHDHFLEGSDPGFCVTQTIPEEITRFGAACQHEVVTQAAARALVESRGIHLEGCGGTNDGVIGALAAVGLAATGNDGRVVQIGMWPDDLEGPQPIHVLRERAVDVVSQGNSRSIAEGTIDVGKHLRPNYRNDQVVLYAEPTSSPSSWRAIRLP
jgi:hypothetical protein